jgi:DNA-directed RNA polymerase subunit beta'
VAELLEARKPRDAAIVTEIDGTVFFAGGTRGKHRILVVPTVGAPQEYRIPTERNLIVDAGDRVRAGDPLTDGAINPHDILRICGEAALVRYLVDEIQTVYRQQLATIDDKHVELIVRQMLRRVRVRSPGDTKFLVDETVERHEVAEANERVLAVGGRPASTEPVLLGVTRASLSIDSFLSAASFQETTRVLTDAAIHGRVDHLRGLKENVHMGRVIPAGTGFAAYRKLGTVPVEPDESV